VESERRNRLKLKGASAPHHLISEETNGGKKETLPEAVERLGAYFRFYNNDRLHQSLGYRTPYQVYMEGRSER